MDKNIKNLSIVSVDPITLSSYQYTKNEIKINNLSKTKKDFFFVSYIPTKEIITATIDISRSVPDEDLKEAIEIKVYDELSLDSAIDYSITYMETESNDPKNRVYNVFVIDKSLIKEQLSPIRKNTKYIDYVTGAPFLLKSLYKKNFIEPDSIDCFIYFQKNDAFLAIYRNGVYLYSKSLHYSLTQITEKFSEYLGERVDEKDIYNLLINEGLKTAKLEYQQYFMKLFGEIFLYINDVLIYAKRAYSLEKIDKIYIGSEIGEILGISEYARSYLGIDSHEFNFSIAINSKEWYIDQIHILMILTALTYFEDKNDAFNFSPFKRPPPLAKRPSGKLLGNIIASTVICFAYPAYQMGYNYYLKMELSKKSLEYNKIFKRDEAIRKELSKLKEEKKRVVLLVKKEKDKLEFRKRLMNEIYKKKIDYPMKALILTELFKISNKYKSKIESVEFVDNNFTFSIRNSSDKKITEFIKELTKLNKYKIDTKKIEKDDKKRFYLSKISIGLKNER